MLKRIREQFGTAGLIVAIVAMVVAVAGTAYAATKLNGTQKKEVEKIAKKFAGKEGPAGAQGAKGDPGAQGAQGAKGDKGEKGTPGGPGLDGKSPEGFPFSGGSEPVGNPCAGNGGIDYEVEGSGEPHYVCNGKEGSPWTAGGILPVGSSETGAWAMTGTTADTQGIRVPLSFPILTPAVFAETNVHFQTEANFTDFDEGGPGTIGCTGTPGLPTAPSGHLCVYLNPGDNPLVNVTFDGIYKPAAAAKGAQKTGAVLQLLAPTGETAARGTFAVTG